MSEEVEGGEGRKGEGRKGEGRRERADLCNHLRSKHGKYISTPQKETCHVVTMATRETTKWSPWQQCHAENCAITHCVVLLLLCHCKTGKVVCEAGNNLFCPAVMSFDCVSGPASFSVVVEHTTRGY